MWIFVLFEKLKGKSSFWYPYFSTLSGCDNLIDWTHEELVELQDKLLAHDANVWKQRLERNWDKVFSVISRYPEYFQAEDLKAEFLWAWKVCCTRTFGWNGGMVIPLAGSTNHGEVYTTYDNKTKSELAELANNESSEIDYSDFLDVDRKSNTGIDRRQNRNRLEKFLDKYELPIVAKIWGLDTKLDEFRSSSSDDDERTVAECTSDEEYQATQSDIIPDEDNYFTMSTGVRTCFKKGEQVFNAYGRLSNRNLLMDYGFATPNNRYDTVYFLLWLPESAREGLVKIEDIKAKTPEYMEYTELYGLKTKRLNLDVFIYFRKHLNLREKNSPSNIETELEIIDKFLSLCLELNSEFSTSIEQDGELAHRNLPERVKWAIFYRIGQKKIVLNQIKMLETLRKELEKVQSGLSLANHLKGRTPEEIHDLYPLRIYLKSLNIHMAKKRLGIGK